MFIRWTFVVGERTLGVQTTEQSEDERIEAAVEQGDTFLFVPSDGKEAYINLKLCSAIVREEVDESQLQPVAAPEAPIAAVCS